MRHSHDECVQVADKASVGELPVSACEHCLASSRFAPSEIFLKFRFLVRYSTLVPISVASVFVGGTLVVVGGGDTLGARVITGSQHLRHVP